MTRRFYSRRSLAVWAGLCVVCAGSRAAEAGVITIANRSDLGANDFVSWTQLGPHGTVVDTLATLPIPIPLSSNQGLDANLRVEGPGHIRVIDLPPSLPAISGENTEGTLFDIAFESPVIGLGFDIHYGNRFHLNVSSFDASGNLLSMWTRNDSSGELFFGILNNDGAADIQRVQVLTVPIISTSVGFLSINEIALVRGDTNTPAVPEPSSIALLATAAVTVAGCLRRRRHLPAVL